MAEEQVFQVTEEKKYDFTIFGATGFTGQYVAAEVSRIAEEENISWAVAGRNVEKLKNILKIVEEDTGKSLKDVGVIQADVANPLTLAEMAKQSRVVLNCVGPYRFYGEAVVKACVENGASHIDISGEPQFLERMQLEYHSSAKENGVYVIGACGFDSIPADLGTVFLEQKFNGELNSVETFLKINGEGRFHYGTWQSAIYGLAHANELKPLRKKLFPERLPEMKPKLRSRGILYYEELVNSWCLPFPGSDRSVVMRSQRYFYENEKKRPIQMNAYAQTSSFIVAIMTVFAAAIFKLMSSFARGRKLLEDYPSLFSFGAFSHEGPSKEQMQRTSFVITLFGTGWNEKLSEPTDTHAENPNKTLIAKVSGPEPGYVATPIIMVQAGIVVLREKDKLPTGGGVYPPGAALAKTSVVERLSKRGIVFETVTPKSNL